VYARVTRVGAAAWVLVPQGDGEGGEEGGVVEGEGGEGPAKEGALGGVGRGYIRAIEEAGVPAERSGEEEGGEGWGMVSGEHRKR
jgi:hypothetical protein